VVSFTDTLQWWGRWVNEDLEIAKDQVIEKFAFGLVERQDMIHPEFQEVAGVLSLTHNSPLAKDRYIVLKHDRDESRVSVRVSEHSPDLEQSGNTKTAVVSIPLLPEGEEWKFTREVIDGKNGVREIAVVVDPSCADIKLPIKFYEQLKKTRGLHRIEKLGDSRRLYVVSKAKKDSINLLFATLRFLPFLTDQSSEIPASARLSLEYPSAVENANVYTSMPSKSWPIQRVPLRIRFKEGLEHIVLGQPYIHMHEKVILDNINGRMLVFAREETGVALVSPPLPRRRVPEVVRVPHGATGLELMPSDSLGNGLVVWKKTEVKDEAGRVLRIALTLVRRYPQIDPVKDLEVLVLDKASDINIPIQLTNSRIDENKLVSVSIREKPKSVSLRVEITEEARDHEPAATSQEVQGTEKESHDSPAETSQVTKKESDDGPADGRPLIDSTKQPSMFSLKMFKSNPSSRIFPTNEIVEQAGNSSVDESPSKRSVSKWSLLKSFRISPTSS
jgi:hypothetical protein